MNEIRLDIANFRSEYTERESDEIALEVEISDSQYKDRMIEDPKFQRFIIENAQKMSDDGETVLLGKFVDRIAYSGCEYPEVLEIVKEYYNNLDSMDDVIELISSAGQWDYYCDAIDAKKTSPFFKKYFEENGMYIATTTPGEGYYGDKGSRKYNNTVGIEGSPLYDAGNISYYGDFKVAHQEGVRLDYNYNEESYSNTFYYFRDNYMAINPFEVGGEWILTGEWLFNFDDSGELAYYGKVKN